MTSPAAPARALWRALAGAVAALALAASAQAADPERGDFDARPAGAAPAAPGAERARDRLRDQLGRMGALSIDPRTDTLRSVGRLDGFLTGPSGRNGAAVALGYVREHAAAFGLDGNDLDGLRLVRRSTVEGIEHLSWQQRYRGIPAADAELDAAVTGSGRLMTVTGPPAPDLAVRSVDPAIGAPAAYAAARRSGGAAGRAAAVARADSGAERATQFADGGRASLTLYRSGAGFRLGWRVLAPVSSTGVYDMIVDARSGAVVRRANRVDFATATVFEYSPAHAAQVTENFAPWLAPGATTLDGPNAHAFSDVHDVVGFNPGTQSFNLTPATGSDVASVGGNYNFSLTPVADQGPPDKCPSSSPTYPSTICTWNPLSGNSWAVNRKQSVTQLFYLVNKFHDHLRNDPDIAFADHNFERTGQPLGNPNGPVNPGASDPVLAQALDGADASNTPADLTDNLPDRDHRNNSNFTTLPDGTPGLMQMYLWEPQDFNGQGTPITTPFGGYDGANDASIVFHEYTHGMTNRLIADAAGYGALDSAQSGAMGEAWSDFYALDYLEANGLDADTAAQGDVRFGHYLDNGTAGGVRFQPIDCLPAPVVAGCPNAGTAGAGGFTYGDFGHVANGAEVHSDGEIWAQTLWSLRSALIAAHTPPSPTPAQIAAGRTTGISLARRYVTEALRLSPGEPSFLDMRNAILQASPDADDLVLWPVFAARGMGYFASTDGPDDESPVADTTNPATIANFGSLSGSVVDEDGHPVADATVGIAGYDTGLGPQNAAKSGADGAFVIPHVPETPGAPQYVVRARKAGFAEDSQPNVEVAVNAATHLDFTLVRDWTSAANGARIVGATGPDNTQSGCGPGGLIDDDPAVVWGSSNVAGGQSIEVDLGAPVDLAGVRIDPAAGCGDDATAALGGYQLYGSTGPQGPFSALGSGAFSFPSGGDLLSAPIGARPSVRFLQLRALGPQRTAPPGSSGVQYIDVAELEATRQPHTPVGATVATGAAGSVGPNAATLTGSVVPHDRAVAVVFEYGTTAGYGATTAPAVLAAGTAAVPVAIAAGGLAPLTVYHYRIVAIAGSTSYPGADATFTTAPATPPIKPPVVVARIAAAALKTSKVTADRKGRFKLKVRFSSTAPLGTARLRVLGRKSAVLGSAKFKVRRGKIVTVKLKLSSRGRKALKPGHRLTVKQELRLPGGKKFKRTLRLSRRRH